MLYKCDGSFKLIEAWCREKIANACAQLFYVCFCLLHACCLAASWCCLVACCSAWQKLNHGAALQHFCCRIIMVLPCSMLLRSTEAEAPQHAPSRPHRGEETTISRFCFAYSGRMRNKTIRRNRKYIADIVNENRRLLQALVSCKTLQICMVLKETGAWSIDDNFQSRQ